MCWIIEMYECGHSVTLQRECDEYRKKYRRARREQKKSFWRSLLRPMSTVTCTAPTGLQYVYTLCDECVQRAHRQNEQARRTRKAAEAEAERQRRKREEAMAWDRTDALEEQRKQAQHRTKEEIFAYRCPECIKDGLWPNSIQRKANGGYCCAGGPERYRAEKNRYATQPPLPTLPDITDNPRQLVTVPPQARPRDDSRERQRTLAARQVGSRAAQNYGWVGQSNRDSVYEPDVAAAYINLSGTNPHDLYGWVSQKNRDSVYEPEVAAAFTNLSGTNPHDFRSGISVPPTKNVGSRHPDRDGPSYGPHLDMDRWKTISSSARHGVVPPPPRKPLPPPPTARINAGPSRQPVIAAPKPVRRVQTGVIENLPPTETHHHPLTYSSSNKRIASSRPMPEPAPRFEDVRFSTISNNSRDVPLCLEQPHAQPRHPVSSSRFPPIASSSAPRAANRDSPVSPLTSPLRSRSPVSAASSTPRPKRARDLGRDARWTLEELYDDIEFIGEEYKGISGGYENKI